MGHRISMLAAIASASTVAACAPRDASDTGRPSRADRVQIKNVVFDVGDVLLHLEHEEFARQMTPIAGRMDDPAYRAIVHRYERGEISTQGFRSALRAHRPENAHLTDAQIDAAWTSQEGPVDCRKAQLVRRIRARGVRTYILSTNNPMHARILAERMNACFPGEQDSMRRLFVKPYFTFELGLLKPDVEVYRRMMRDARIEASETLFLDDTPENILGAQRAGMLALLVTGDGFLEWLPRVLARPQPPPPR